MPMHRKKLETIEGDGRVRFSGHEGPVRYAIEGDLAKLRLGTGRLRGALTMDVEHAADAFRAGAGVLTLEAGVEYRLTMVGHTSGGTEVFVEVRI